mgnify:FL=1
MVASASDKLLKVGNPGSATTLSAPGYTIADTAITVGSTSNWSTDTGVVFAIDEAEVVDGREVQVAGTYNEYIGTVASGTGVTNVAWQTGVGDRNYASGALTRVYIPVSAERENRLIDGILVHADQDGSLKDSVVTTTKIADSNVTTAKIADSSITNAKLSTTAGEPGGSWQTWIPTWANITLGSGTVVAKYTKIGKFVEGYLYFTLGAGSAVGSSPTFSLPVPASSSQIPAAGFAVIGQGLVSVAGNLYDGAVFMGTTGLCLPVVYGASGTYVNDFPLTASLPAVWASGNYMRFTFKYEAA